MRRRSLARATAAWSKAIKRSVRAITRATKVAPIKPRAKPTKFKLKAKAKARAPSKKPARPAAQRDWSPGFSMGSSGARRYWLYRPPDLKRGAPVPLLVMLHGCTQDAAGFAASTRMNTLARRGGFMVLYPEQSRLDNPQRCWNWYDTRNGHAQREATRIVAAIDQVMLRQAVDGARIAVLGLSAGASMAALLATRHPTRFRAVVMHSGIAPGVADSTATALAAMRGQRLAKPPAATQQPPESWPPLMVIQGESDPIVSPRNGLAAALSWAQSVGSGSGISRSVQRGQRYPMTVTDFKRQGRTVVTLVAVAQLGHAWSGGAAGQPFSDPKGPDATGMAWTFVSRQFRQAPQLNPTTGRATAPP